MKVIQDFYCTVEKKTYKKGDEYTGKRTDIGFALSKEKEDKNFKVKLKNK